jgi:hypothetical protein
VTDTAAGGDTLEVTPIVRVHDAGFGDVETAQVAVRVSVPDALVGADAPTIRVSLTLADAALGTDIDLVRLLKAVIDAGAGADADTVAVRVPIAEQGGGAEALALAAYVPVAEASAGADSLLVSALLAVADAVAGADTDAVAVQVDVADLGAAEDALSAVTALVAVLDRLRPREVVVTHLAGTEIVIVRCTLASRAIELSLRVRQGHGEIATRALETAVATRSTALRLITHRIELH